MIAINAQVAYNVTEIEKHLSRDVDPDWPLFQPFCASLIN